MKTNDKARALIKKSEALRLNAYLCPKGVPTIGYGSTKGVKLGQHITLAEAERLFDEDVAHHAAGVERHTAGLKLNENQFGALVSLAFNIGVAAFGASTLLRKLRDGDFEGATGEFARWNKADGKVLPGLVERRAAEADLFLAAP